MALNRYSQRNRYNQFRPVSFDEYMAVPLATQQVHDQALAKAMANKTEIDALNWHIPERDRIQNELNTEIDSLVGDISQRGVIDQPVTQRLIELRNRKDELFGQGSVGAQIQNAVAARQKLAKDYDDLIKKGDRSPRQKQQALAVFDKKSQQLFQDGQIGYQGRLLSPEVNIQQKTAEYLRDIPMSTIERDTGWSRDPQNGRWVNSTTKESSRGTPQELMQYAMQYMQNDPDVMNYLQDQAFIDETLAQRDEMGNVIYGDQYYNPNEFSNLITQRRIQDAAQGAVRGAYERDISQTQDMRNMSEAQMYGDMIQDRINNPIFRDVGYFNNPMYNEDNIESILEPSKTISHKLVDNEGNTLTQQDLISEVLKLKSQNAFSRMGYDSLSGLSDKEVTDLVNKLYRSRTTNSPMESAVTKEASSIQRLLSDRGLMDYKELSKSEKNRIKRQSDDRLQPLMNAYNSSVPQEQRVRTIDEFRSMHKNNLVNQGEQVLETVDYNIPSTDLMMQDIQDGNLQVLRNKSMIIQGDGDELTGSNEDMVEKLEEMIADGAKVSTGKRVMNGEYAGGRAFDIRTKEGKTYTVVTEPLSRNEQSMFNVESKINNSFSDPTFYGEGQGVLEPHPTMQGLFIEYQPVRSYEGGTLNNKVKFRVVDQNRQPVSDEKYYNSMSDFHTAREQLRRPYYSKMFQEEYLTRKMQPNQ